jgi:hypothetical protein
MHIYMCVLQSGRTCLYVAATSGRLEMFQYLLEVAGKELVSIEKAEVRDNLLYYT